MTTLTTLTQSPQNQQKRGIFQKVQQLSDREFLSIIIILAVSLRLASAVMQGNQMVDLPGIYDQISYDGLARRVVDGYGFSFAENHWPATRAGEPTAHWSYLYTLYLAMIYKLFGVYPFLPRVIQAVVTGIFQTLFIWRIGHLIFGRTVGFIAALISAVYIYFFYYAGALVTESFYIVCILWTLDVAFRLIYSPAKAKAERFRLIWVELGFAIGLTVLLRQVFLLFLPFLFLWIWWNLRGSENSRWKQLFQWSVLRGLLVATIVLALMILPFTIRNYRAFGTFVLLNTNAGFAFFWGNHPIHATSFVPILPATGPSYQDLIPQHLLLLNEAMLDKALLREGVRIVLEDPVRYIVLSISRIEEYIKFWPSLNSGLISNLSRVGSFGLCLPFILYGLWLSLTQTWKSRTPMGRWAIGLLLTFIIVYTAIHLFTWTLIRYRLPVDAVLLLFAAIGVEKMTKNLFHLKNHFAQID